MAAQNTTGYRTALRRAAVALLAGALCVPALAGTAQAAQVEDPTGGGTPTGYTVQVTIEFSGEGSKGGATYSKDGIVVAPECWYEPAAGPYTDAVASLAWYDEVTGGRQTPGEVGQYGPRRIWEEAAEAEKNGTADTSWYRAFCIDPANYERYDAGQNEDTGIDVPGGVPFVTYYYRTFNAGETPPPPLVDPDELARVARDEMEIPVPATERNPMIKAPGAPTLVGLPTWFWVTNPEAVGGADGNRDITARLGDVFATVTAETAGLHLNSPAGSANCAPARAQVKYTSGASAAGACTIEFARASVAYANGYPLAASTNWGATWVGSGGTSGTLDGLARDFASNVPVAEVQNIVTRE